MVFVLSVAAAALLAGPLAAQTWPPRSCDTDDGGIGDGFWSVSVDTGYPCNVVCNDYLDPFGNLACDASGDCTAVQYSVDGSRNISHVAVLARALEGSDSVVAAGPSDSSSVFGRCEGDVQSGLGKHTCHEQAIRYNSEGDKSFSFYFVVQGRRVIAPTTVLVEGGNRSGSCEIVGVGEEEVDDSSFACVPNCGNIDINQTMVRTEILKFKGCDLVFEYDTATGDLISVGLTAESENKNCDLLQGPVGELELSKGNTSFGLGLFGDGLISTGSNTCSCRIIGGRYWCWGLPCPD
jgi:hypothetical protein